jgi:hypothetical protein
MSLISSSDYAADEEVRVSRLQSHTLVSPRSITALVLRIRALVVEWIQIEVDEESITGAEGIVSEDVVKTFLLAGGDLVDAVPFALLESRKQFTSDARTRAYALNEQRALVCEVVARRAVAMIESLEQSQGKEGDYSEPASHVCLSKRFIQLEEDGDKSLPTSTMESAVDQNCVIFLSSSEAQRCAEDLWKGSESVTDV